MTQRSPQREIITAIECRDRSRPVTVGQVEEFHAKCQDTGVNKGVIVSSTGFYETARRKAAHYGIDCLTFAEVESVNWSSQKDITSRTREVKEVGLKIVGPLSARGKRLRLFFRAHDGSKEDLDLHLIPRPDGELSYEGKPTKLSNLVFPLVPDLTNDLRGTAIVEIGNPEDFLLVDDDATEHPLLELHLELHWRAYETTSPVTFHQYGAEKEHPTFETMTTMINAEGRFKGQVTLIKDQNLRFKVLMVQDQTPSPEHFDPQN